MKQTGFPHRKSNSLVGVKGEDAFSSNKVLCIVMFNLPSVNISTPLLSEYEKTQSLISKSNSSVAKACIFVPLLYENIKWLKTTFAVVTKIPTPATAMSAPSLFSLCLQHMVKFEYDIA